TGELIAFVDADHELDREWTRAALPVFDDPCTAAAGAPYASPADANRVQRAYGHLRTMPDRPQVTQWLGSGNLVVRRKAFEALRGFDTTLEACEDVDFCNRLAAAGYRLLADPALRSVHRGDPSTLRAVFRGELWRGRNNMRVTLRGPLTARALVSLLIPMTGLMCLAVLALSPLIGWQAGVLAAGAFGALTLLRTLRMSAAHPPTSIIDILDNLAVALAYDAARALALVFRATHRTRHDVMKERALV
ncbi:MAG TPA: glycosyltransferase family 2 protein, partial [Vicinamibacterales bacterium]|nr:glycosyltransferase family 2 protein [Vicinamibacterales bacterium]